jgi:hypothetical protein
LGQSIPCKNIPSGWTVRPRFFLQKGKNVPEILGAFCPFDNTVLFLKILFFSQSLSMHLNTSLIFFTKQTKLPRIFLRSRIALGKWSEPEPNHFPIPERELDPHQDNAAPQHYFKVLIRLIMSTRAGLTGPGRPVQATKAAAGEPEPHKECYQSVVQ